MWHAKYLKFLIFLMIILAPISIRAAYATATTCVASDQTTLATCVSEVKGGTANQIEITTIISCSGAAACAMNLAGINGTASAPIEIYGDPGAGFSRSDTYNYYLIGISNSSYINISNLSFFETATNVVATDHSNALCDSYSNEVCNSPISIYSSSHINLDKLTINDSKNHGIEVSGVTNLSVTNSIIENSFYFGIWFDSTVPTDNFNITIEGDTFYGNRSNAILYTASATDQARPSIISNNAFNHNHHNAAFYVCGNGAQPCNGGQLDLLQGTSHLVIANNVFSNGYMDALANLTPCTPPNCPSQINPAGVNGYAGAYPGSVTGIEVASNGYSDVTIERNTIDYNSWFALFTDPGESAQGLFIYQNEIAANLNGTGSYLTGVSQISAPALVPSQFENCWTTGCLSSVYNTALEIGQAGLGCIDSECMWMVVTNAVAGNCAVGIYAPDWSSKLATITVPDAGCTAAGVSFKIPGWISSEYGSVNVNYQSPGAGTWSSPILVSLAGAAPKITGAGLGCAGNVCMWITATDALDVASNADCEVSIYSPDWTQHLATMAAPNISCSTSGASFYIPSTILANYTSVYVNFINLVDGTWSPPVKVTIH